MNCNSHRSLLFITCVLITGLDRRTASAVEFAAEENSKGVTVMLDGALFTEYLFRYGKKPILWPIIGPTGKPMTRAYPMDGRSPITEDERDDPHHSSFWFSHGKVNGIDLWSEKPDSGSTEHREFVSVMGGKNARIVTKNTWLDQDKKKIAEDQRTITCAVDGENRIIDFDIVIKASADNLEFGDTKEGTFARLPDEMTVAARKGGQIVNSEGLKDQAAWGQPAAWVDYHGPVDGEVLGVVILNHPSSARYPTCWHVRDYGLFAANPFGTKSFPGGSASKGNVVIDAGDTLRLRYRVIFHKGDEQKGKIAASFFTYSTQP